MNRYDDDDIPLTDADYEGVVYEPSYEKEEEFAEEKPRKKIQSNYPVKNKVYKNKTVPTQKKQSNQKSRYKIFMLTTIISGIIISAAAFALVYNSISPKSSTAANKPNDSLASALEGGEITAQAQNSKIDSTNFGVIRENDTEQKKVNILSFDDKKTYDLEMTSKTELKDKYDNSMTLQEFKIGDIVDFVYDKDKKLVSLKISSSGWCEEDVTGVKVNSDNNTINFNNKSYSYSELLGVTFKGTTSDISKINELDKVTITGYNNMVYSLNIEKGHGIIQITNKDKIKDGKFEVDNNIYKSLSEIGSVNVTEGSHRIIVKGSNCETFTKDINVSADETFNLNLSEVHIKTGVVLIKSNVSGYLLTINNTPELSREPLVLEYGAYNIKLEKEGYDSFETQIILNSDQKVINAELEKEVKMGKVTINSVPEGAEVYIDNAKVGYTPVSTQVTQGKHNITVNKSGYIEVPFTGIDVTDKETLFNITLQKEPVTAPEVTPETTPETT